MAGSLHLLSKVFTTHKNKFFIVHCVFLYLLCFLFQTRISLKYLIHAFTEFLYFDVPFKSWKLKDCKLKFVQVIRLFLNENIISVASKGAVKYHSFKSNPFFLSKSNSKKPGILKEQQIIFLSMVFGRTT